MPTPMWLVDGVLPEGGLCALYGPPGTGKSFVAVDFAMSIATSRQWHSRDVTPGYVLYISAEGGSGIGRRAQAWSEVYGVSPRSARLAWLPEPIPIFRDSQALDILLTRIEEEVQETPRFVVVDTLARCFDGDENSQEDMGRFVSGVDRLRREFGATLLVVHHTRLDGDRERGNTAFRGAADTMISLNRDKKSKVITLACSKQKDWEEFDPIDMTMDIIDLPGSTPQNVITSCVMRPMFNGTTEEIRATRVEVILEILSQVQPIGFTDLRSHGLTAGLSASTLKRGLSDLKEMGLIMKVSEKWQIVRAKAVDPA